MDKNLSCKRACVYLADNQFLVLCCVCKKDNKLDLCKNAKTIQFALESFEKGVNLCSLSNAWRNVSFWEEVNKCLAKLVFERTKASEISLNALILNLTRRGETTMVSCPLQNKVMTQTNGRPRIKLKSSVRQTAYSLIEICIRVLVQNFS